VLSPIYGDGLPERSSAQDLPSLAAAVEAALESRLGCGVTYIGSEEVFQGEGG